MSDKCKECNQTINYQGWPNYETWAFALWIDNERGTYETAREFARKARFIAPDHENVSEKIWTVEETQCFVLADALKEWAEENAPDLGATVWSDLLSAALGSVDWHTLAEHYLEEE